MEANNTDKKG